MVKKWEWKSALTLLQEFYSQSDNKENVMLYKHIDEIDYQVYLFYIIKYSIGELSPQISDLLKLKSLVMETRDNFFDTENLVYKLTNGMATDFHLLYFLQLLFLPFDDYLSKKNGFSFDDYFTFYFFISILQEKHENKFTLSEINLFFEDTILDDVSKKESKQRMLNYLEHFCIESSSIPCTDFSEFQKNLKVKPIIKFEDYYLVHYGWLRVNIHNNFHYLLSDNQKYKKHRGKLFEKLTADLFSHYLEGVEVLSNVKYPRDGEIDIVINTENTIILVECKSSVLYDDYKRGLESKSVKSNIESIIAKSYKQLNSSENFLLEKKKLTTDNRTIFIEGKAITKVCVCWEAPIGIVNRSTDIITLSWFDLAIIFDLINEKLFQGENCKNILEYFEARKKLNRVNFGDELPLAINLIFQSGFEEYFSNASFDMEIELSSESSLVIINDFFHYLHATRFQKQSEKSVVQECYFGYFRDYILSE